MDEQCKVRDELNDFLQRRGLRANFLAKQVGISASVLYNFKTGGRLLTQTQLRRLRDFMRDYNHKLDGTMEGGEKSE